MSESRTRAVRIAQAERSSAGAARMGFCGFAARAAGHSLTNTPMAHLRKKERWLDHARARIEGKSLAKTAQLCGVHPTTAFHWRHRFRRTPASDKQRMLRGIVEAGETFVLESFKGRWSDLPRKARKRGGTARRPGLHQDNIPVLVARDLKGATFDAVLPQVDSASVGAALASVVTPGNHLIDDGTRLSPLSPAEPGFRSPRSKLEEAFLLRQTGSTAPSRLAATTNAIRANLLQICFLDFRRGKRFPRGASSSRLAKPADAHP
jgi:hypothetical protein